MQVAERLRDAYRRGKTHALAVIAEGALRRARVDGVLQGQSRADRIRAAPSRASGTWCAAAHRAPQDRVLATRLGAAVDSLAGGKHGVLVGIVKNDIVTDADSWRSQAARGLRTRACLSWREFCNLERMFNGVKAARIHNFDARYGGAGRALGEPTCQLVALARRKFRLQTLPYGWSVQRTSRCARLRHHAAIVEAHGYRDRGSGIRVMLVDSHRLAVCGLQRVIDDESLDSEWSRLRRPAATNCGGRTSKTDVVVLDADLAGENEAAVVPNLINGRNTRVLLLAALRTLSTRARHSERRVRRSAQGVPPPLSSRRSGRCTKANWLDRSTTGKLFVELSKQSNASLSARADVGCSRPSREQDVVRSLVSQPEADNKTLASTLHIGEHTLRNHLSRIYDSRAQSRRALCPGRAPRCHRAGGALIKLGGL